MTNVVSKEAIPSLDYLSSAFRSPSYDARISETRYEYFYPVSGVKSTNSFRWTIPANAGNYVTNMESLILALDLKITDKDRKNIPSLDIQSAPTNNFCNSIFSALRICYNTTCVLKMDHFPVYSYVRMLLNNDQSDLLTWANTRCFYPDDEDAELDSITCKGWKKRREMFGGELKIPPKLEDNSVNPDYATKNGKFAYSELPSFFIFKLDTPLVNNPLLPGVNITVELDLNRPEFCFQSLDDSAAHTNINFAFERARLYCKQTKLNDKLYLQLEEKLRKDAMRQFFTTTMINTHSISKGNKTATIDSVGAGYYPSRLYLLFQEQSRFEGKFSLNSLKFPRKFNTKVAPFLLQKVRVTLKGQEIEGLSCDDANFSFRDEYFRLMNLTNQDVGRNAGTITFKSFKENSCILVYDFTSTLNNTEAPLLPLIKKGHIRVEVDFDRSTTDPVTLITMLELQSVLTIEGNGKCTISTI